MCAIIQHRRAVDYHVGDAVGVLVRFLKGGVGADGIGIEAHHVGLTPSRIRSLADSTWYAPWASMDCRKNLAAALTSEVLMPSLMATMPMFRWVSSAWTLIPSSKIPGEAVKKRDDYRVRGQHAVPEILPARPLHRVAAGDVGEDVLLANAVVGELKELRLQVHRIVSLATLA